METKKDYEICKTCGDPIEQSSGSWVHVNCDYANQLMDPHKPFPVEDDPVNHPKHYTSDPSGVECIQITRHRNFNIGNAMKYLWRAGLKDVIEGDALKAEIQDLKKALWYINDEVNRLTKE